MASLSFALGALHFGPSGLRYAGLRFRALSVGLGVALGVAFAIRALGFAFRSSGLPWFSSLWFCDWLGNVIDFDELGRRGQDR
jgi:hypothetical protein